ncbi:MAG: isochorismatase family protein [Candidatus Latescibacteria bacterium]|nr:isochorismatase family protein [Candidatus Latescibacterota bacterium]
MSDNTALLVIDIQAGSFTDSEPAYDGQALLARICTLVDQCRAAAMPIVYIQHCGGPGDPDEPGTDGWPIHPLIVPQPGDEVVQKHNPDAFHETDLEEVLLGKGIGKLIVAGLQTEYCVDTTVRRAFSLGYEITLVGDCHTTWDGEPLSAAAKIDYHNTVLGSWFAKVKRLDQIEF